ncbi:MAG: DUF2065 domain-containing protein [Steroidobacteraceae bacterium]|nr:DUF2065 domain-containing protein [Steroidobacteraceae bacterium]MCC7199575.1 DUF2065 domain-containing protein [Gammaproteobacteria bacterium]
MNIDWGDLTAAFALYLVIEGVMPFVSPRGMKQAMSVFQRLPDAQLRVAGAAAIAAGIALLWYVRH